MLDQVAPAVEQVFQERHDVVLPHPVQAVAAPVDLLLHQVRRADRRVGIVESLVQLIEQPCGFRRQVMLGQPACEQALDGWEARVQFDEHEPAAHRSVDPRDRPVGGVHRADQEQVLGKDELLIRRVLQADRLVAVLQQEVQLAEHLGQVRPVDLVDDQDVGRGGVGPGYLSEVAERPGAQRERQRSAATWFGPEAFEEVLVGVGRVELDELNRAVVGQVTGQFAGEVSLAGPGRPIEDDLLALPEQIGDLHQFCLVHQQAFGEIGSDRVEPKETPRRFDDHRGRLGRRAVRDEGG